MSFFDQATISHILSTYGYAAVFVIVMLESTGIPMPGETILVTASIIAGTRHSLDIRFVIAAAALGAILGDNFGFWIGRGYGRKLLDRYGSKIGFDERKRKLGQYLFHRYGGPIVFFGRFIALLRTYAALLAGINRLAPGTFFIWNAIGGVAWALIYGIGGYLLGKTIDRIAGPVGWVALGLAVLGGIIGWRFFKQYEEQLLANAEVEMDRRNGAAKQAPAAAPKTNVDDVIK